MFKCNMVLPSFSCSYLSDNVLTACVFTFAHNRQQTDTGRQTLLIIHVQRHTYRHRRKVPKPVDIVSGR